jgi:tRNA (Thr-GGU) A37 N-methylase
MRIHLEPIGIIKKAGKYSEIMIYSDFEQVVKNVISKIGTEISGQKLLIVHKNRSSDGDGHQVQITKADLIERVGNILKVGNIDAYEDSVIDVRLDTGETTKNI